MCSCVRRRSGCHGCGGPNGIPAATLLRWTSPLSDMATLLALSSVPGATVTNTTPVGAADTRDNGRWRDCLRSPSPRRERRGCGRRRGGRGGDVQCDRRHALLIGAVAEDIAQVVGIMTNADAVAAVVMRAEKGGVGVAAFGAPAAASRKATNGLRCSSAPWLTTLCVSLGPRRTDTRSTPSS